MKMVIRVLGFLTFAGAAATGLPAQLASDIQLTRYETGPGLSIMMPHEPVNNTQGSISLYSASAPLFPTPPHKFYFVCTLPTEQGEALRGEEQFSRLQKRQRDLVQAIGGTILEESPIRWKHNIGLRTIFTHREQAYPVPTITVAYSLWTSERILQISYGELNFYGDIEIGSHYAAASALEYFQSIEAAGSERNPEDRVPLQQELGGSWVVRQAWVGSQLDLACEGSEYTFNPSLGTFRRLSPEQRETGQVAGVDLNYPSSGKFVVNHDRGHIDFHDAPLTESGEFMPGIFRISGETLEIRIGETANNEANRPAGFDSPVGESSVSLLLSRPGDKRPELEPSATDVATKGFKSKSFDDVMREAAEELEKAEQRGEQLTREEAIRLATLWQRISGTWTYNYSPFFGAPKMATLRIEPRMEKPEFYENSEPDSRHAIMKGNVNLSVHTIRPISTGLAASRLPLSTEDEKICLEDPYQDLAVIIHDVHPDSEDVPQTLKARLTFKDGKPVDWLRSGKTVRFTREDETE